MKTRNGFVSNSSSASFVIALSELTEKQITAILVYNNEKKDHWVMQQGYGLLHGCTLMDNGDLGNYLEEIGISREIVIWL